MLQILGATKPGPWTGQVLAKVIEWQLDHLEGTSNECEAWLKAEHEGGNIVINEISGPVSKRGAGAGDESKTKKAKR